MKRSSTWLKLILIALVLLLSAGKDGITQITPASNSPTIQGHAPTTDHHAQADHRYPTEIENPSVEAQIVETLRGIARQQEAARREDRAREKRWWPPSPSWAIVYVTIIYVVVAVFQWSAIKRQGDIAERALVNLERAWLVIEVEPMAHLLDENEERYGVFFKFRVKNLGRSIGWITSGTAKAGSLMEHQEFPEEPSYDIGNTTLTPLAPGQSYEAPWYEERVFANRVEWLDFVLGKRRIILYGAIHYRDAMGGRETRYCVFAVQPSQEHPHKGSPVRLAYYYAGPTAYNRYT